jgi:hypothetical protein
MFRAADHDDARTMLLPSQVLRLARTCGGPTAAGQCRLSTGFPWLISELTGRHGCGRSQCPQQAGHASWRPCSQLLLTALSLRGTVTSTSTTEQARWRGKSGEIPALTRNGNGRGLSITASPNTRKSSHR